MSKFGQRYAVQVLADGGISADLETGSYVRLNLTAARICAFLAESEDTAEQAVAHALGVSAGEARAAIEQVRAGMQLAAPRRDPPGAFRYGPSGDGSQYLLSQGGIPKLWVHKDGSALGLPLNERRPSQAQLFEYLRATAPKLLFLRGATVLHGSACWLGNRLRGWCGQSGAGKTTTAHAFADGGLALFAEDMLVLSSVSPLTLHRAGEEAIRAWASDGAARLLAAPNAPLGAQELDFALAGDPVPVGELWFLDASQRTREASISPRRLAPTDAAVALMGSLFLGAASSADWRRFLNLAGTLATTVPLFEAEMPAGIDRLRDAARRYAENSAS